MPMKLSPRCNNQVDHRPDPGDEVRLSSLTRSETITSSMTRNIRAMGNARWSKQYTEAYDKLGIR